MATKNSGSIDSCDLETADRSSSTALFPCSFDYRNQEEFNEHISNELTSNQVVYYAKLILGVFTLVLPIFNVFTVYRSLLHQRRDLTDTYSTFHSIIFYGEFAELHTLLLGTFLLFLFHNLKTDHPSHPNKGQWINFLDLEFTLMAFNMIKIIPIISMNGFTFLFLQISVCVPVFRQYSRSSQIIAYIVLALAVFVQAIFMFSVLVFLVLIKVYQLSFIGQIQNPLTWTINQWLLFIGYAANIINITDTPTISQLSFMWRILNVTWSSDSNLWLKDARGPERKDYIVTQICERLGFIRTFLWLRTMTAFDLHCLIRLPPSDTHSSKHNDSFKQSLKHVNNV